MEARYANAWLEQMSQKDLRELQLRRLVSQVRTTYERNAFYRELWDNHNVDVTRIHSLEEFAQQIPMITKQDMIRDQESLQPFGRRSSGPVRHVHMTSGTTGIGQEVHVLSAADIQALGTRANYEFHWAGLTPGAAVLLTLPYGLTSAGSLFYQSFQSSGLVPLFASSSTVEAKFDLLRRFGAKALIAVPAYLHRMEHYARQNGIDPRVDLPALSTIFTAAESFSLEWAMHVEDFWGAQLHEWYGATQSAGNVMFTCENGAVRRSGESARRGVMHTMDQSVVMELIDPDTDEIIEGPGTGELVVTVLHREAFPCIRFRMGDRATRLEAAECDCGRPFTVFESGTISRYDDMMKIRGLNIWPETIDAMVLARPTVAEYRGVVSTNQVNGREDVTIEIEFVRGTQPGTITEELRSIGSELSQSTGLRFDVTDVPPDTLPRYDFKVRRWTDTRRQGRAVVHHLEGA